MPELSLCVPVYRAERYIAACARSLFEQTLDDIEYIFVDDGSPDRSIARLLEVAEAYPRRLPQIRIITHPANRGSAAARNTCLEAATGTFVGWCDSDDRVEPEMYRRLVERARETGADLVWCNIAGDALSGREFFPDSAVSLPGEEYLKLFLLKRFLGVMTNKLIRRDLYLRHGIRFPEGYDMMEDTTVLVRALRYANRIDNVPQRLYHYIRREGSITSRLDSRGILRNVSDVARFCTEQWAGDADIIRCVHWYEQRHKYHLVSRGGITPEAFRELWRDASGMRETLANPTIPAYGRLVCLALDHGFTLPLRIKQHLAKMRRRDG